MVILDLKPLLFIIILLNSNYLHKILILSLSIPTLFIYNTILFIHNTIII